MFVLLFRVRGWQGLGLEGWYSISQQGGRQ